MVKNYIKNKNLDGLYDPSFEHDACGLGFVANIKGVKSHKIIQDGIKILENLEHRGATGADPLVGDGAGMLLQIPHEFFENECKNLKFQLPNEGNYGIGVFFMPQDNQIVEKLTQIIEETCSSERTTQLFIKKSDDLSQDEFERKLFVLRKCISNDVINQIGDIEDFYPVSLSSRTIVYKGMFLADQLAKYYPDLSNQRVKSALALVHQRFSTNTFPSWKLAHPYRMVSHNGEINTLRGNYNWMAARQASLSSPLFGDDIKKIWPISYEGQSDTACFDNALELLVQGGYSISHAMMMLIPEAWSGNPLMDEKRRSFYEYHAAMKLVNVNFFSIF